MTLLITTIWVGGIGPAYVLERASGASRLMAALDASLWPLGIGRYLVERFYVTDNYQSADSMTRRK